jgi:hypothetical protein
MSFAMGVSASNFIGGENTRCTQQRKNLSGCRVRAVGLLGSK